MNSQRKHGLKQIQDTVLMKLAILEKQKLDVYEFLDEFVDEISNETKSLLHINGEFGDYLNNAKGVIEQLDKASELFTQIIMVTHSCYSPRLTVMPKKTIEQAKMKQSDLPLKAKYSSAPWYLEKKKTDADSLLPSEESTSDKSKDQVKSAVLTETATKCPISFEQPKTQYETLNVEHPSKNDILNVAVTNVDHPWSFHVQMTNSFISDISTKISEHINSGNLQPLTAKEGMSCLANYIDGCYYRALIKSVEGSRIEVKYIDFGNTEIISKNDIYELPENLASLPAGAIWCALEGVCPTNKENMWSEDVIHRLQQCICDQQVKIQRQMPSVSFCQDSCPLIVKVVFDQNTTAHSLSKYLIKKSLAKAISLNKLVSELHKFYSIEDNGTESKPNDKNSSTWIESKVDNLGCKSEPGENTYDTSFMANEKLAMFVRSLSASYENNDIERINKLNEDSEIWMKIIPSFILFPNSFFVHSVDMSCKIQLEKIEAEINVSYTNVTAPQFIASQRKFKPCIYSLCCALSSSDELFYRGLILDIRKKSDEIEKILVFFIDFGDFEWLPEHQVFSLTKNLEKLKSPILWCSLTGIKPTAPHIHWSPDVMNSFKNMIRKDKDFYIVSSKLKFLTGQRMFQNSPIPVYLIEKTDSGDEICINKELIDQGLASVNIDDNSLDFLNYKSADLIERKQEEWDPMSEDFNSLRNSYKVNVDDPGVALVGYSSNRPGKKQKKVCSFYNRSGGCHRGQFCPNLHTKVNDTRIIHDKLQVLLYDEDQTLLVPTEDTNCQVTITHVLSPSCFYVHFVNRSKTHEEESLEDLMSDLESFYKESYHYDGDLILFAPSQAVAARVDGSWIRGKVLDTDVEKSLVQVMSVDYGSVHRVKESNVRELDLRFIHLTPQAVQCGLSDVEPVEPIWTDYACNTFSDVILGKTMHANIDHRLPRLVKLSLHEMDSNQSVSDCLVDMGLAKSINSLHLLNPAINKCKDEKKVIYMPG